MCCEPYGRLSGDLMIMRARDRVKPGTNWLETWCLVMILILGRGDFVKTT